MTQGNGVPKKPPVRVSVDEKLLVSRQEAAQILSIGLRSLDYLVANKQLAYRRIGSRILIATTDLQRFARADHPDRLAS
jgi:excisionase family DNA binding protein